MFNYLNAAPRVTYLARIKNPNPLMPGAELVGMANGAPHGAHDDHAAGHGDSHATTGTGNDHGAEKPKAKPHH
jgi:hypothetical protein